MVLASAVVLVLAVAVMVTLSIRKEDLPQPEPEPPAKHLEERKAAIYENLRDLQFEYRVGKLSDADYQQTKLGLQKELAGVIAEIEKVIMGQPAQTPAPTPVASPKPRPDLKCRSCGATFTAGMRFCGQCGKAVA